MAAEPEDVRDVELRKAQSLAPFVGRERSLHEKLIYAAVKKGVSERLGTLLKEMVELSSSLSDQEKLHTKVLVLNLINEAATEFHNEMGARVLKQAQK